jgi:hypothetical protein
VMEERPSPNTKGKLPESAVTKKELSSWTQRLCLEAHQRQVPSPPVLEPMATLFVERFAPDGEAFDANAIAQDLDNDDNISVPDDECEVKPPKTPRREQHVVRVFNLPYDRTKEQIRIDAIICSGGVSTNHEVSPT